MSEVEIIKMDKYGVGATAMRVIESMLQNPTIYQLYPNELKLMFRIVEMDFTPVMKIKPTKTK